MAHGISAIRREIRKHVDNVHVVDTHCHMGSVNAMGIYTDLRMVLEPGARTAPYGIFDLLCAPYMYWGLPGTPNKLEVYETAQKDPGAAFRKIKPCYKKWTTTGEWQAVKLALRELYAFTDEMIDEKNLFGLNEKLRKAYEKGYYAWGREVLRRAGVEKSMKMVQIPWLLKVIAGKAVHKEAKIERNLIFPICSIDIAIQGPSTNKDLCRDKTFEMLGFIPKTADDYREFVKRIFGVMDKAGVYGLKNATGYGRDLNFVRTTDRKFDAWVRDFTTYPDRRFIASNYLMRQVLAEANARTLTIQMHAGVTSNRHGNPYALFDSQCLADFPDVKFALLHVYPFHKEHAVLLRATQNLYSDLSWLGLCSGSLLEETLAHLIGFSTDSKVVIGLDATNFEETYGAMTITRRAVENVLVRKVESGYMCLADAVELPYRLLRNNAISIWRLPLEPQFP